MKKKAKSDADLWQRWRLEKDVGARDDLFERHLSLIQPTLTHNWQWLCGYVDRDDAEIEAKLALLNAVERFDPEYGTKFVTFAVACITTQLRAMSRKEVKRRKLAQMVSLEVEWETAETIPALTNTPEWDLLSRYEVEALEAGLEVLEEFDRLVLEAIFYGDLKMSETGEALGKSAGEVQRVRNRALKRLKKWMEKGK